ncbi:MAG: alpha-xylosidase, partial [Bacteroidaceae bacterium]|nr:alpha-xylosidase [Bacteroidaceae bacterium]
SRDVYLPGGKKWIDYQTGKVYSSGWNHIEAGELPIIVLVADGTAIPHVPVAQHTGEIKWDKLSWKHYKADAKKTEGLLCLPSTNKLETKTFE